MRQVLPQIVVAWLLLHTATLALAPSALWHGDAEALVECSCTHGDHAVCPMHHKPAPDSDICLMRGANDAGAAVLTAVLGGVGLLPAAAPGSPPQVRGASVPVLSPADWPLSAPPDSPPPRL